MSFFDLSISAPVLRAQQAVQDRARRIARINDQFAELQYELAREVKAMHQDLEEQERAIKHQTDTLGEVQGELLRLRSSKG